MRIVFGSDHAGVHLKSELVAHCRKSGYQVLDVGTESDDRVDYPDFGTAVAHVIAEGKADRGVAVCGSGIGICMAANKVPGVRAGVAYDTTTARLMREHNDAQIVCFGERLTTSMRAVEALEVFLATSFAGGRHADRVAKLDSL